MKRYIFEQLRKWKGRSDRKPLLLMGARQVGKTYTLQTFGASEYENTVYLNFEDTPSLCSLFHEDLAPERLLKVISIETGATIIPGKTLIIFDEVQECPEALNSLKYFKEDANAYHICAASSLLSVKLKHTRGFPVGKVDCMNLYPLSFKEFLDAIGEEKRTEFLSMLNTIEPLPTIIHKKLLSYFKEYLFTGGMPECVKTYYETKNFETIRENQLNILKAYSTDFAKHAPAESILKINQVWDVIPSQLAKENKKFIYSVIRKGARASQFEFAIQWLFEAGVIHKVYQISTPKLPLKAYVNFEIFKLYLVDTGLLGAMANLSPKTLLYPDQLFQAFSGAITENYIAQELKRMHYDLFYWASSGRAEVDYVIQHQNKIYPLEIKLGMSSRKKSLLVYKEKYQPQHLIRTSPMNLKQDDNFINCPLYLLSELPRLLEK